MENKRRRGMTALQIRARRRMPSAADYARSLPDGKSKAERERTFHELSVGVEAPVRTGVRRSSSVAESLGAAGDRLAVSAEWKDLGGRPLSPSGRRLRPKADARVRCGC